MTTNDRARTAPNGFSAIIPERIATTNAPTATMQAVGTDIEISGDSEAMEDRLQVTSAENRIT
ncbi:MAG: hypothetical protein O3A31_01640 [Planctomycetota bacterium]|nr:hypothetical protein [Planctomycetota bacterium]